MNLNNGSRAANEQSGTRPQDGRLPDSGSIALPRKLSATAEGRALGVLADPLALLQAGPAAPFLAVVNERCGDLDHCQLRYMDVTEELGVSLTTIKAWAETLERLGYFTRRPCGPAGVEIRLNPERWPAEQKAHACSAKIRQAEKMIEATRIVIEGAFASAAYSLHELGETA